MRRLALLTGTLAVGALLFSAATRPHPPGATLAPLAPFFRTADRCIVCHSGVTAASGEDVSIGYGWRGSMMANSARDPYWQASVPREVIDHAGEREAIEDECSKCHMPMARVTAAAEGRSGRVFAHLPIGSAEGDEAALAADGVSCTLCHQILPDGLGDEASFSGGFRVDEGSSPDERDLFGPFEVDAGRRRVMHSATGFRSTEASHLRESAMCATCHTLATHALGAGAGGRLPEQMPYQEWLASDFAGERTCQGCHMPPIDGEVAITSVLGQPRSGVGRHVFLGGNFFMLRMLNRYRAELGVNALPQELDAAAARTVAHLQSETARVDIARAELEDGRLVADVLVTTLAGHKFPTAYPSRRAWLNVTVRDDAGAPVFESGTFAADGSIAGNDHDADPLRHEPHHRIIERADQVQIYESVMGDPQGRPTTGLLTAVRYLKDNRLLPRGFERRGEGDDVGPEGDAAQDPDFTGGADRVRYAIDVGGRRGPFQIEVALWFQPIGFRLARALADYDAPETRRFVAWYDAMAPSSALVVARAERTVP